MHQIKENTTPAELPTGIKLHMGIAEQGKLYAIEGNHKLALLYYRNAMSRSVEAKDPEVFFRHYLEAALESMEKLGYNEEVLAYCDKAIQMYEENPPANEVSRIDLAYIHQKRGITLMKLSQKEEAKKALKMAIDLMKKENQKLPLAITFLRWLASGLHLDTRRLQAEQDRNNYYHIRKENVDPKRAIKLPDENLLIAMQG